MTIEGIRNICNGKNSLICIDSFSEQLKNIIREQLSGVFSGFSFVEKMPSRYTYPHTLKLFLENYKSKSEDIKKGMIAELLVHILLNNLDNNLKPLSILSNKEENSIKKGFDIIYCHTIENNIWYTEVKSGNSSSHNSTSYNTILLKRAKDGLLEMFRMPKLSRWESALRDIDLMIRENENKKHLFSLLDSDTPQTTETIKKNAILVSVLYHSLDDEINVDSIIDYHNKLISEGTFLDAIVISIQKPTFQKIAQFLIEESDS